MNILITGGLGFIGHNVVRNLSAQGHNCILLDNETDYGFIPYRELRYLIKHREQRLPPHTNYHADIVYKHHLFPIFEEHQIDCVIHLASFPRQKVVSANPTWASEVMVTGLINLLECAASCKVDKFVYVSSSMVYGDFKDNVKESAECNPQGQYAIMKYMGEKLLIDYARRHKFNWTVVRPSAVYGDWDVEDRVVSKFMLSAMTDGILTVRGAEEKLDFTYVEDTAMGIAQAATTDQSNGKVYNITRSNEHTLTLLEAAELIVSVVGKGQIQVQDRDLAFPSRGRLCIDQARNDFDFNPAVNVEQGFKLYHKWFENSEYWQKILLK